MANLDNAKIYKKVSKTGEVADQYDVVNLDATNFCITLNSQTSTLASRFDNINTWAAWKRDADGHVTVADPYYDTDAANKGYVDSRFPSSSTDNALVRFDGTSGKIVQNSKIISEDNGDLKIGRYTYNVLHAGTTATPQETIIHTKIKYASMQYMPVIRVYGYAYGQQSPIEFKLAFYIYGGDMGWCGAISMGAWRPTIYIFKENVDGTDYIAVGLKGECYYLGFDVDLHLPTSASGGNSISTIGWTVTFNTSSTSVIPTEGVNVDVDNSVCRRIPYKSTLSNLTITADGTTTTYNGASAKTFNFDNIYLGKTAKAANSSKLNGQEASYYLNYNNFTNTPTALSAFTNDVGYITTVAWNDITDKPSTFTPSAHTHPLSDITGVATIGTTAASTAAISTSSASIVSGNTNLVTGGAVADSLSSLSLRPTVSGNTLIFR